MERLQRAAEEVLEVAAKSGVHVDMRGKPSGGPIKVAVDTPAKA